MVCLALLFLCLPSQILADSWCHSQCYTYSNTTREWKQCYRQVGEVPVGQEVILTAPPCEGWKFKKWDSIGINVCEPQGSVCKFTMPYPVQLCILAIYDRVKVPAPKWRTSDVK